MDMLSTLYLRATEFIARKREGAEEGQGMVEYALILVLIAIVVIVILQVVGKQVNNVFSNISNGLACSFTSNQESQEEPAIGSAPLFIACERCVASWNNAIRLHTIRRTMRSMHWVCGGRM